MNYLSLREIQIEEIKMARAVHEFCEENHIVYYLAYGSLLGAVRHKGFIPWDDDMDLCMPRQDYDKFCRSFKHDDFIIKYCENETLHAPFAKVCNPRIKVDCGRLGDSDNSQLWVDIFPLDGVPDNESEKRKYFRKNAWMLETLMYRRSPYAKNPNIFKNFLKRIVYIFYKMQPAKYDIKLSKKMEKLARSQPLDSSDFFAVSWEPREYPIELNNNRILYPFENESFYSWADADQILRITYGDYMKLPPQEERGGHYMKAFYVDE